MGNAIVSACVDSLQLLLRPMGKHSANHKTETIHDSTMEEALSSPECESAATSFYYGVIVLTTVVFQNNFFFY